MKKSLILLLSVFIMVSNTAFASVDKTSEEYLKNTKHITFFNPVAEYTVSKAIKHSIKREAKGDYKVKFKSYNITSLKKGIFKYLEITGKNVVTEGIEIPYFKLVTVSDYNWIDYNENPVKFRSNIEFDAMTYLSEKSINDALEKEEYKNIIRKVNQRAYPLLTINDVNVKIKNDNIYITMGYNFPLMPREKPRTFTVSSGFKISQNNIEASLIRLNNSYTNLPVEKIKDLVNYINPLSFTLNLLDNKKCDCKINSIIVEDNLVKIGSRIYIKKEG